MEATFSHYLEYEIDESPSIGEIIATLEANDYLLRQAGDVLERCLRGLEIQRATVAVRSISQESPLRELFAFAVVMTFQKRLEHEVPQLIEKITGAPVSGEYDALVTVLVMLIAIYGISAAFKKIFPGREPKHLNEEYTRLISVAGDYINVTPNQIDAAVRETVDGPKRRSTELAARRFFSPVQGRKNRGIRGPGSASISEEAIAEVPLDAIAVEDEGAKTDTKFENDVQVTLHAADRDRAAYGWAGHIPGIVDTRVRMQVDKSINPEQLFGRKAIRGDVLIVYDITPEGDRIPKEFHLLAIRPGRSRSKK